MNKFLKLALRIGAVISGVVGMWVLYVAVVNFWKLQGVGLNIFMILFELLVLALAFGPGFMLWKGWHNRRWQCAVIFLAEGIVMGLSLWAMGAWLASNANVVNGN